MPFDATIVGTMPPEKAGLRAPEFPVMLGDFTSDPNIGRNPDYFLYLFNTSPRTFTVRKPPLYPCLILRGCKPGEAYVRCARIPSIVNEKYVMAENGQVANRGYQGERVCQDIVNPLNLGVDVWASTPAEQSWLDSGGSDDLTRRGVFWTVNEVPTAEELSKSKERLESHYRVMLAQADELYNQDRAREIGPEHHAAAVYFRLKSKWHLIAELPESCPNCGDELKKGAAFHMSSLGVMCVLDWRRAVDAGVKSQSDVPKHLRWWTAEPAVAEKGK